MWYGHKGHTTTPSPRGLCRKSHPFWGDERDQRTAASRPCVLPSILGQICGEAISGDQKGLDPPGLPRGHVGAGALGFGPHWRLHSWAEEDLPAGTVCPTLCGAAGQPQRGRDGISASVSTLCLIAVNHKAFTNHCLL